MRLQGIFWILCFFFIPVLHGQNILTGVLKDTLQQPLAFANVFSYLPDKDSTILTFTQTDLQGKFSLAVTDTTAILQFSFIGYESVHIPVKMYHNSSVVVMKPKVFTVQVTEVVEKPPLKQIGDTLIFNADAYKNGNERTVEDLIKKIPGFDVAQNGKISFGGKGIDQVLVEGDKIGQKDYTGITQKLNAKVVEDIYVIPDYEANPLLAEFNESSKIALNLTLKEGYKNQWFGSVDMTGGIPKRYGTKADITGIRKKTKLIADGNYNNIADFPANNNFYPNQIQNTPLTPEPKTIFKLYPETYQVPDLLYKKNKIHSGSLTLTQRFKHGLVLNLSSDYADVQQSYFQTLFQNFFLAGYPVIVSGLQLFNKHNKQFYAGGQLTYLPLSLKHRVVYEGYFSQSGIKTYNGILGISSVLQKEEYKHIYHHYAFEYDYKIKKGQVILFKTRYRNIYNHSQYDILPINRQIYVPGTDINTQHLYQHYTLPVQNYSAVIDYVQRKYLLSAAFLSEKQMLNTHIDTLPNRRDLSCCTNAMYYQWHILYGEIKANLYQHPKQKLKKIQTSTRLLYGHFMYKKDTTLPIEIKQKVWVLPNVLFSTILYRKLSISFSYQYHVDIPKIQNFQYAYTFTDFRSLEKGTTDWFPNPAHTFFMNANYFNIKKGIILFSLLNYAYTQGRFNTQIILDSLYTFSMVTEKPTTNQQVMSYFNLAKSLPFLQHRVKLKMLFNTIISPSEINTFQTKNTLHNYQPSIGIASVFSKWINYEFNMNYVLAQNRILMENSGGLKLILNNHRIQPNIRCIFNYKVISLSYQHYFEQQYIGRKLIQSWHWANASIRYDIPKYPQWRFSIMAHNLYGLKQITDTYTISNQQTIQHIRLQPRIIMAQISFSFG